MIARFGGRCNKNCGTFINVGDTILWGRGQGAEHVICPEPIPAAPAPVMPVIAGAQEIVNFLKRPVSTGKLKFPKVRFLAPDGCSEMRLSMATAISKFPGTVQVKVGMQWIGRINADGSITSGIKNFPNLLGTLTTIAEAPALAAKAYGALMGRCSFCNLQLTDDGSVEVGYGPICAKHYGLPHTAKGVRHILTTTVPVTEIPVDVTELPEPRQGRFVQIEEAVA